MNTRSLAIAALILWLLTLAVLAWFFVRGTTAPGSDGRTAIVLSMAERDFVLSEMRGLLATTQAIVEGVRLNDMTAVARAANAAGTGAQGNDSPALMAKLPLAFKTVGLSVHGDMDAIARAAESGAGAPAILKMVADNLNKCVTCHAAWQFQVAR